jgi:hypothetical protein
MPRSPLDFNTLPPDFGQPTCAWGKSLGKDAVAPRAPRRGSRRGTAPCDRLGPVENPPHARPPRGTGWSPLAQLPQSTAIFEGQRPASPATARATPSKVRVVPTHWVDRAM